MDNKQTQLTQVYNHLLTGKYITPLDALQEYGCFRLSAVIHKIRHNMGVPVETYNPQSALLQGVITPVEYIYMSSKNFAIYRIQPSYLLTLKTA